MKVMDQRIFEIHVKVGWTYANDLEVDWEYGEESGTYWWVGVEESNVNIIFDEVTSADCNGLDDALDTACWLVKRDLVNWRQQPYRKGCVDVIQLSVKQVEVHDGEIGSFSFGVWEPVDDFLARQKARG